MAFNFSDKLKEDTTNNTLIVDALNLAFRWKHLKRTDFRYEYEKTVHSFANSYRSKKIIIAADWGNSTYRKELYPEYKADRKRRFADQTEEEKALFEAFFQEFEETLKLLENTATVLRYKGVEADDIAAHLVKNRKEYGLENIWLISSDGDWDLLVEEDVSRFSYVTRKEITSENWYEHHPVTRDEYISMKCLMGDKGDNIPGISGVGPKRAQQLIETMGSALDIYDVLPIECKYKYMQELNNNKEQILINYELMDLLTYCDDAIGEENIRDIKAKLGVDVPW